MSAAVRTSKTRKRSGPGGVGVGSGKKIRIRMYRVGFGDFFLVSLPTQQGARHILIDCGVHAGDLGTISDAVSDMAKETGRHLSLVIVTHRHADHISGFATCVDQFREFTVDTVWMSWWDDPANQKATRFQANLRSLAATIQTHLALRATDDLETRRALEMVQNITGDGLAATGQRTAGERLAKNDAALAMLRGVPQSSAYHFKSEPLRHYYKAGDPPELPPDLVKAGLSAQVLGPPIDENLVAQMNNSVEQYLSMVGDGPEVRLSPFGAEWRVPGAEYPKEALYPNSLADIERLMQSVQPDSVAAAARKADNSINNQSLVVHFTVGGKNLLFVGDAQWGDWENFLFGGAPTGRGTAQLLPESAKLLAGVNFYKVGHHGSTNATPIVAVKALRDGCVAMCSTEPDCYGKPSKGSEVPRMPLLDALMKKTGNRLVRSDQILAGNRKATRGLPTTLPPNFSTPGKLYIDCHL